MYISILTGDLLGRRANVYYIIKLFIPMDFKFKTLFIAVSLGLGVSASQAQLAFELTAPSLSSTTVTLTISGTVTTISADTWGSVGASTHYDGGFTDFIGSAFENMTFALSQAIVLENQSGGSDISLTKIYLDADGGSNDDDFGVNPASDVSYSSGHEYTVSGSATFDITGVGTFNDFSVPSSSTLNGTNFNLGGFGTSNTISTALAAVPEPSTYAGIFGGLALMTALSARRRR